jgi:hypothetical protein
MCAVAMRCALVVAYYSAEGADEQGITSPDSSTVGSPPCDYCYLSNAGHIRHTLSAHNEQLRPLYVRTHQSSFAFSHGAVGTKLGKDTHKLT